MKSLNSCVQEFIDHHSSTLFPTDNTTNTRHPRLHRFNSIPSSSDDIEEEDPNLFVITPPIEYFLDISSRFRREQFFQLIQPGHILICNVLTASSRDMLVRILCFDDGHRRALHDLKITATCLLNTSNNKHNNHRRYKYERDVQEVSDDDDDKDDAEYQSGDFIRACVSHSDSHKEEIQLTIDSSTTHRHHSTKKLGLINEDDLPKHYVLLRRQEEQSQSYEDILQTTKAFNNRACVQTLYQRLKKRFEYLQPEINSIESSNDILHMTLMKSFKKKQIPANEYFDKLRQKQDQEWAIESVAQGVRLMKDNDSNSAVLHFNKALATYPKCVDALVARGALLANQGHYKRAMQDFEDALKIDSKHVNASTYLHDVLNNLANETHDYNEAIYYLEKALKYKVDDSETKKKLDLLRSKKKEMTRKMEYGPNLPTKLQSSSKKTRSSRSPKRRKSSSKGSLKNENRSKRKRSNSTSTSSSSSSSSTSRSSSSSSSSTTNQSLSTISSSSSAKDKNEKTKSIPVIDISENDQSTTTSRTKDESTNRKSISNENSIPIKSHEIIEQRKTLPSKFGSSSADKQPRSSSSSTTTRKRTPTISDREAADIEKLYMELKAKQSVDKQKRH